MNRQKLHFNSLLRKYFKYKRRLHSLHSANRNERRQKILARHIERLYEKLMSLKLSIQKSAVVTTAVAGAFVAISNNDVHAQAPQFPMMQTNPFNLQGVNGYDFSNPSLGDIDNDGDLDLISGYYIYDFDAYQGKAGIIYYENTGTATNPNFAAPQQDPFGLSSLNQYGTLAPTFVDLDNDGDLDIMITDYYGTLRFFENTGSANSPSFGASVANPFNLTSVGAYSTSQPSFADLDNDGDLDLIVGERYNYNYVQEFFYYENIGTAIAPNFGPQQANPFSLNPVGSYYRLSHTTFSDIDGDGDYDLIIGDYDFGSNEYNMHFFENIGNEFVPEFGPEQVNPFGLEDLDSENGYIVEDLDGDGVLDILAGDDNQDFYFWKGCMPTASTVDLTEACEYTAPWGTTYDMDGTYMGVIPNAAGCDSTITLNLTIEPLADITFTDNDITVCGNNGTSFELSSSQNDVNYYLRYDFNDEIVSGPVVGNGSAISLSTGTVSTDTTYNVYARKLSKSFGLEMEGNSDNSVIISGVTSLTNASFSVEFWAKRSSTGSQDHIFSQGIANTNQGLHIGFRGNNHFTFAFFGNDLDSPNPFTDTDWHHYAVTYNNANGERIIYRDGVQVTSGTSGSAFTGGGDIRIGDTQWGSDEFGGEVDEVRIWSTVRNQTEITDNMNVCLDGTEVGLEAYYQFEDGLGSTTVTDKTANGYDGTLVNIDANQAWVGNETVECLVCELELTQTATITINPLPDNSVTNDGSTLTANLAGADYRWLDCNNGLSPISGETGQSFTPSTGGSYAVEVDNGTCIAISACQTINILSLTENEFSSNITIYPNPAKDIINIDLGQTNAETTIKLVSIEGKEIYENKLNNSFITLDVSTYPQGTYILQLSDGTSESFHRIVKN